MNGKKKFLRTDFEASSSLLGTYVSMRLAAMAALVPFIAFLLTQAHAGGSLALNMGMLLLMLLVASSTIRIVGAINRNIFARCLHLARLEEELNETGFYCVWVAYVKKHSKDASSYAFVVACRMINVGLVGYVIEEVIRALLPFGLPVSLTSAGCVLVCGIINEVYIRRDLSEAGFISRLEHDLTKARLDVIKAKVVAVAKP